MTMEDQKGNWGDGFGATDQFPVGMSVLVVDDDPTCLKVLEGLLLKCRYQVTTTKQAIKALTMLRENKDKYDLVISDVSMPDMDGFKLLELVGLEMDIPVIMLSAHSDAKLVMKGVTHGACDYLLKPVRIEELMNIWQHVVRRKKFDNEDQSRLLITSEKACIVGGEVVEGEALVSIMDHNGKNGRKRKDQNEDEEEDEDPSTQKKPRVVWSSELHSKFVAAVNQLGFEKAFPKKILNLMNVEGLTRENVASHLQKYRQYLKRMDSGATPQADTVAAFGGRDSSYMRIGFDGFGRLSTPSLSSYKSGGIVGGLNFSAGLNLRGISSSGMVQPTHEPQNLSGSINTLGNLQSMMLHTSQGASLVQRIPESNCTTSTRHLNPINGSSGFAVSAYNSATGGTVGLASDLAPGISSSLLMPQENPQRPDGMGVLGHQYSQTADPLHSDSADIDVGASSTLLDYTWCKENWPSATQLPKFPSNSLSSSEPSSNNPWPHNCLNVSPTVPHIDNSSIEFTSISTVAVPLGDEQCLEGLFGNVVQDTTNYTSTQSQEENERGYNQTLNRTFNSLNSAVSAAGLTSSLGQNLNQSDIFCSKRVQASSIGRLNGAIPSYSQCIEDDKFAFDTNIKSNDMLCFGADEVTRWFQSEQS